MHTSDFCGSARAGCSLTVDVFINAPDVPTAGRSRTYTMDAGSMTLVLQVNDAVTGTLLAVAFDKRRTGSSTMQWTTSVSNRAAAEQMLKGAGLNS